MFTVQNSIEAIQRFNEKIITNQKYLNELDGVIGDGDHGDNLAHGLVSVMACLAAKNPTTLEEVFQLTGTTFIRKVGGASGVLYGSAFLAMGQASKSTSQTIAVLEVGLLGMKERGHGKLGEKTLIDLWEPAIEQLKQNKLESATLTTLVENSKALVAMKGRAACLGEASIGQIDPGIMSSTYFFEALLESGCVK